MSGLAGDDPGRYLYKTIPGQYRSQRDVRTALVRRIGRINRLDRVSSGFLAKKTLIFLKIILRSKERAQTLERRRA
jgi:hypothetical protein